MERFHIRIRELTESAPEARRDTPILEHCVRHLQASVIEIRIELEHRCSEALDFVQWCDATATSIATDFTDPFAAANEVALQATASLYGIPPADLANSVPVVLEWENRPPGEFGYANGISAKVSSHPRNQLRMVVCPSAFGQESSCALPYVLLHEYVCHAARLAAGGPPPSEISSTFAEGWMDHVAMTLHDEMIGSGRGFGIPWLEPPDHKRAASYLHHARVSGGSDRFAPARDFGSSIAELFQSYYPGSSVRPAPLHRLSVLLNASSVRDSLLDVFVYAVWDITKNHLRVTRFAGPVHDTSQSAESLIDAALSIAQNFRLPTE